MPTIKLTKPQARELKWALCLHIAEIECIDEKMYRKRVKILYKVLHKIPYIKQLEMEDGLEDINRLIEK